MLPLLLPTQYLIPLPRPIHTHIKVTVSSGATTITPEPWIIVSLIAMLANVAKVLLVKTYCRTVESWTLLFFARLLPGIVLLTVLYFIDYRILDSLAFWGATLGAAIITIGASLLYMEAVKRGDLSLITPIQATVPVFMIGCTFVLYGEIPDTQSLAFILMIVISVSFVLQSSSRRKKTTNTLHNRRALAYSLFAAALFGISTVLDRIAINATTHGALVYSAYWHLLTLLLLVPLLWVKRQQLVLAAGIKGSVIIYVLVVLAAFISQQFAVQLSLDLDNGVTFVKTIVMTHIVIASAIGIIYLKERASTAIWIANLTTAFSGIGLLWSI